MDCKLHNISIVVLSEGNNPKLLNHDFLARNSIVPENWEVKDLVITPPFSQLLYKNGVQFIVEINKLHFKINDPDAINWQTELPIMATKYLKTLPHVNYNGVGINFVLITHTPPEKLFTGFLRDESWRYEMGGLSGAAIELQYRNQYPNLNVKIEEHAGQHPEKGFSALSLQGNYHHVFEPQQEKKRHEYILQTAELSEQFINFAKSLPLD